MRQQFTPLILCLFLSLILVYQANGNSFEKANFKDETLVKAAVSQKYQHPEHVTEYNKKTIQKQTDVTTKSDVVFNEAQVSFKTDNSIVTEFSHSFKELSAAKSHPISAKILTNTFQYSENPKTLFYQGLFYGFILVLFLLNGTCYLLFEEKLFLYFTGTLALMAAVLFYNDGLLNLAGVNLMVESWLIQSTLLFGAVGLAALFSYKYLDIKGFFPKLKGFTIALLGVSFVLLVSAWISKNELLSSISNTVLYTVLIGYFIAGMFLFSKKNYAKFYVIASCIPLLFSIDFFVFQSFDITFLYTETIHIKIAVVLEMLLLTFGITYRMKAIKEEIELRQTEMRIFIKRKEMMNRENITNLMKDEYLENLIMQYDLDGLEIKLLQYISEGVENPKIARKLKMTEANVEELTNDLYMKLEIREQIKEDHRMVDEQPDYIYN
ncbi:7TM-DISM domain-containing protein [Marixanthomonas ophiurae]|uniref:Membrane protein n=1 Tax=Marixanthomonas ophiurae TaxID=387659 RepID=A0A3E1Q8B3_9FLAO|nr:7TM-DISM domain-containing protein [Marixanthomonas ophiurae]RFN58387.1 membrane protein [Marixanthomonas ophiurae]